MSRGRPEILFPLFAGVETLPGVGPKSAKLLERIDAARVRDLLFTLPTGLIDRRPVAALSLSDAGSVVTVEVVVHGHRPARVRGAPHAVTVEGGGTAFEVIYFQGKPGWVTDMLPEGATRIVSGKLETYDGRLQMPHPDHVLCPSRLADLPRFEPVYPLTAGLSLRAMQKAASAAVNIAPALPEWIGRSVMEDRGWPDWRAALASVHQPTDGGALAREARGRQRLAYDEMLSHQLALRLALAVPGRTAGRATTGDGALRARAASAFGYAPTSAQTRAADEIASDMAAPARMRRLLQGDVGSGKTWVAMMALLTAVEAGRQGALMAPTEILARQHAEGLAPMAHAAGIDLMLLTGRDTGRARAAKLMAIADGTARIVIGTHALFSADVTFRDLAVAMIDEQHRFGVRQRRDLAAKAPDTDLLVMTATPIPRTLQLAGYGDLEISVLDEKPPGRQPVTTRVLPADRVDDVIDRLGAAIDGGAQAYWVCPLVDESDAVAMVAAEARHRDLAARFGADKVRLVHGQLSPSDKDAAMADFQEGRARILVATTVIEVGVNVPNATIMVIEQAERFGLAQLHQLRGRVGRGEAQSTCLLLYRAPLGETAEARLRILRETEDGFRIAEEDLRLRGAGDVLGLAQAGSERFRIADAEADANLMVLARDEAKMILNADPDLTGERGEALRILLYLMDRDESVRLMRMA